MLPVMMVAWMVGKSYCPLFASHSSQSLGIEEVESGLALGYRLSAAQLVAGIVLYVMVEEMFVRHCCLLANASRRNPWQLTGNRWSARGWHGHRQSSSCCWEL